MKNVDLINFYNWACSKNIVTNESLYSPEFNWFVLYNLDVIEPIIKRFRKLEFSVDFVNYLTEKEILHRRFAAEYSIDGKYRIPDDKLPEHSAESVRLDAKYESAINKQKTRDKKYSRLLNAECATEITNQLIKTKLRHVPKLSLWEFSIIKPLVIQ